ncbi:MAG: cytochrome P450 [Pseudonocardiales bacterium]|nr:cytochrome P450 [Pseudonocardiales bacterium]
MPVPPLPPGFDFTDPDVYAERVPLAELAALRRSAPVWWNAQRRGSAGFDDEGYWVVTRHADVRAVSLDSALFSSAEKTALVRLAEGTGPDEIAMQRLILLNTDPPQHAALRRIVARGFTPRAVAALRDALADRAERIARAARDGGTGDFVRDVASELPLQAIAELLGIPQDDRGAIFAWSNRMIGSDDAAGPDGAMQAAAELLGYAMGLAEERRERPRDDIVTALVQADVDGRGLTPDEFGFFVILLAVAGNETTRNAISHGMAAFLADPEQWALYRAERPATTADEIVRWATPVVAFQRTATADTELGGQAVRRGDRVALFYSSANHDEEVFTDPHRFDITRDPNPHLGFGGHGAHYCVGANLARLEIELMFSAIADHLPGIAAAGEPTRLRSGWLNGITAFPVRYR